MKGPLAGLMQQAQRMQEDMKRAQDEIANTEVTGTSGGGVVSVDRSAVGDDHEMMEDLIAAAFNDAVNKVAALSQEKLGGLASGMNLPPGFKLPF